MRLNDNVIELITDLLLILRVLAKSKDQVLGSDTASLGASQEESQALVNDTQISVFKVFIDKQYCQEVSCTRKLGIFLNRLSPLIDDLLAKLTQSNCVALLVALEGSDVVLGEEGKQYNMRA